MQSEEPVIILKEYGFTYVPTKDKVYYNPITEYYAKVLENTPVNSTIYSYKNRSSVYFWKKDKPSDGINYFKRIELIKKLEEEPEFERIK